ncbi:putative ABC transport system permease protein [Streptosporangium becharense]|uniref:Putative ABC transport system permease protein n=1 Tax=Streptosporangium becharense TaxID=1816182 RepID=A0A7W9IHI0_9ACTN|nr:ABC transporter permease [Streptosporangium becharense]MBB2914722.1 putative ABC transport system permease protein [Streptosporangium becharense]MBB5820877.1 putative ABC transport system permease protein [Streptosporangium becharense]
MSWLEVLRFAFRGLAANKLRSFLTTLGILIGVAAVILLVAFGEGASQSIQKSIQRLGANTLTISSSFSGGGIGGGLGGPQSGGRVQSGPRTQAKQLTLDDARALADKEQAPSVRSVSPVVSTSGAPAVHEGAGHSIGQLVGTYPSYFEATNKPIETGSYFVNDDVLAARKVMVVGRTVAEQLFGSANPVGRQVSVSGVPFTVIGVLKESGSAGQQDADDVAIVPLPAVQQSLTGFGPLGSIIVQATGADTTDTAQAEVTAILNQRHGITPTGVADYRILNQATLQETVSSTIGIFTTLLGAVAAISLLVGGIGITNIMLVTVTERTREIGIRKAIGAPRSAILGQFLLEATVLSLVGGLSGVLVAFAGTRFTIAGIDPVLVPSSIMLALGVSVGIGLFFGGYPANRAAKLRPIQALRHE